MNAIDKARHLLAGVDRLRARLAQPAQLAPPAARPARHRREPAGRRRGLAGHASPTAPSSRSPCSSFPPRPTRTAGPRGVQAEVEGFLRDLVRRRPVARGEPADASRGTPRSTRPRRRPTRRACARCSGSTRRSGCRPTWAALGSWYDGATFALEAGTPALMYGPQQHRPRAHRRRVGADRRPRRLRAGLALAGLAPVPLDAMALTSVGALSEGRPDPFACSGVCLAGDGLRLTPGEGGSGHDTER